MDKKSKNYAVELFLKQYGKTHTECGFPFIDIYEKQSAFLYGTSYEAIKAYKTCQNILRWIMLWYLVPLIIAFCFILLGGIPHIANHNFSHQIVILPVIFFTFWVILFFVLWHIVRRTNKISKNDVIWLNY